VSGNGHLTPSEIRARLGNPRFFEGAAVAQAAAAVLGGIA
jgi:hypothetical protein